MVLILNLSGVFFCFVFTFVYHVLFKSHKLLCNLMLYIAFINYCDDVLGGGLEKVAKSLPKFRPVAIVTDCLWHFTMKPWKLIIEVSSEFSAKYT